MDFLTLTILILAVVRIARFVGWDGITQKLRERLTGYSDDGGKRNRWPANHRSIGEMIHCPFCFSAWVSVLVFVAWKLFPDATILICTPVAIAGAAGLINSQLDHP